MSEPPPTRLQDLTRQRGIQHPSKSKQASLSQACGGQGGGEYLLIPREVGPSLQLPDPSVSHLPPLFGSSCEPNMAFNRLMGKGNDMGSLPPYFATVVVKSSPGLMN